MNGQNEDQLDRLIREEKSAPEEEAPKEEDVSEKEDVSEEEDVTEEDDIIEVSPEDAEKLKKFIKDNTHETQEEKGDDENPEDADTPEDFPQIPRDQLFDPYDDAFSEADELPAIDGAIEITTEDKESYLRSVLNDDPVMLTISLCDGAVNIKIRARTAWEQSLVYEAIYQDQEMKIVNEFRQGVIQLQKYSASLMIQTINGRPFSTTMFEKKPDSDLEEDIEKLRNITHKKVENMDGAKLTLILNALRIFEFKIARIGTQCLTGNFWNPAD